jgi:hypothetical protein
VQLKYNYNGVHLCAVIIHLCVFFLGLDFYGYDLFTYIKNSPSNSGRTCDWHCINTSACRCRVRLHSCFMSREIRLHYLQKGTTNGLKPSAASWHPSKSMVHTLMQVHMRVQPQGTQSGPKFGCLELETSQWQGSTTPTESPL